MAAPFILRARNLATVPCTVYTFESRTQISGSHLCKNRGLISEERTMTNLFDTALGVVVSRGGSDLGAALLAVSLLAAGIACSSPSAPSDTPTPVPPDTPKPVPSNTPPPPPPLAATPEPPREPFRLGFIDIGLMDHFFSGVDLESRDGPATRSALLAVEHVNAAGGVFGRPVEPHFRDTLEETAVEHAIRLIEDEGVHAFVGPGSSEDVIAVSEAVAVPRHIPFIAPGSTAPFVSDISDDGFIFRTSISDEAQGFALARLARDEGYDRLALVHRDDAWGNALADAFIDHFDGEVTKVALHPDKDSYAEELHEVSASSAHALVILTFHDGTLAVMDEVVEFGHFDTFLLYNDHRSLNLLEAYPDALDGAKGVAPAGQHITEAEGHWEADYAAKHGAVPHAPFMRETYDAAIALMLAAEYAGSTDGEAIRDALSVIARPPGKRFPASAAGVVGALQAIRNGEEIDLDGEATDLDWDDRGEIIHGHMGIWQFNNGAIEDIRYFDVDISE